MKLGHFPYHTLAVSQDCGWNLSFVIAKNKNTLLYQSRKHKGIFFFFLFLLQKVQNCGSAFSHLRITDASSFFKLKIFSAHISLKALKTHRSAAWYPSVLPALASSNKTPRHSTTLVIAVVSKVSASCFVGSNPKKAKLAEDHREVLYPVGWTDKFSGNSPRIWAKIISFWCWNHSCDKYSALSMIHAFSQNGKC